MMSFDYKEAQTALKGNEKQFFSVDELDKLIPEHLRKLAGKNIFYPKTEDVMKMTGKELKHELYEHGVYDAYQFVENTHKTIMTAAFCKDTIAALIGGMESEHNEWLNSLFSSLFQRDGKIKTVSVSSSGLPSYPVNIAGVETTAPFLINKLVKDFFQYVRNSFDCMSQAANAGCLAYKSKIIEIVDFPKMNKVFSQESYSHDFSQMASWYSAVQNSSEYKYIDAFCNRTKHTCDVYLKLSMSLLGDNHTADINPFFKKGVQHDKQAIIDYLNGVFEFLSHRYSDFLDALLAEISQEKFIEHRYHKLNIYQQKMKDSPESSFSMAYIETDGDISRMPDYIQVLFLTESDGEITARNCPIDTIYVKVSEREDIYVGKYIATEPCGDDTLLQYRRYEKEPYHEGTLPLQFQAMTDEKQKGTFYHSNPFMDIRTISDDDEFLKRVQLPF